jgi:sugar O-acyltransferase (sialic acid O-acetyltransferase NeuD family)
MGNGKPIVVYGAGGFAREVEWLIHSINLQSPTWDFRGYVVSDLSQLGPHDSADAVVGDEAWLLEQKDLSVALGIGTPGPRVAIGKRLLEKLPDHLLPALVAPSATFDARSCDFGPGSLVCAECVFTVNIKLEPFALINIDCTIGHEATIGFGSVLNPSVNISGGVHIKEGVLVGTGAQILQYIEVGEGATVGAGAVVSKPVPPGETVVGIPAKPLRR